MGDVLRGRLVRFTLRAIACAFFCSTVLLAQQPKPSEYQVKAAYLYNFAKFVMTCQMVFTANFQN